MNLYFIPALIAGCVLDILLGDPEWLYHPVCIIGKYISFAERSLRARGGNLRRSAVLLTASTVCLTMLTAAVILLFLRRLGIIPWFIGLSLLDWMGLAAHSMVREARGVETALARSVEAGRQQIARIVGRDTDSLDKQEIIQAAVETVAENTTDGVISPMIYAAFGGPILLWGFKAASTLDSMVGYMDEHYRDIGWSSARLDDLLNYIPARLNALLMILSAYLTGLDGRNAFRIVCRDHSNHRSPNRAWSESAAAGALHIQLGGTHLYFGKPVVKPTIGDDDHPAEVTDIRKSCRLLLASEVLLITILVFLYIFL
jgi:adenosylcobinamide-phosphate synthase